MNHYSTGDTLYVLAENGLNLRSQPDRNADVLKTLKLGSQLEVLNSKSIYEDYFIGEEITEQIVTAQNDTINILFIGNWVKVRIGNQIGFVVDTYLTKINPNNMIDLTKDINEIINLEFGEPNLISNDIENPNGGCDKFLYNNGIFSKHCVYGSSTSGYTLILPEFSFEEVIQLYLLRESYIMKFNKQGKKEVEFETDSNYYEIKEFGGTVIIVNENGA